MGVRPRDILLHMQVPDTLGLYVLGVFESRVTVYSQQVRALNLIYSLSERGWLQGQAKVAVIGAGVAGLTAAAAAAHCGAEVVVLEHLSEPLSLIGRSVKRWLHPHIYEWPKVDPDLPDPLDDDAGLPLMNWRADTVNKVREQLLGQYKQFADRFAIKLTPHVADISILPGNTQRFSLTWNEPVENSYPHAARRSRMFQCDLVILAVGFGLERQVKGIPFLSYWSSDNLDGEDARFRGRAKRILVSGTGDGGLVDILRIRLRNFSHHTIVKRLTKELLDQATLEWLTGRLNAIEAKAENAAEEQKPYEAKLNEEYQKLGDELAVKIDIANLVDIRPDTQAVVTGLDHHPLSLRTSVLNRLLYSVLPDVKYLKGPWTSRRNTDGSYKVTFAGGAREDFDEILIRHGPDAALKKDFPAIWKQCAPLMARSILDQTRFPIYGDFFGGPTSMVSLRSRMSAEPPPATVPRRTTELKRKRQFRRASLLGLAAIALLISIKTYAEDTNAGRWFKSLSYESLRSIIPPHDRHEALPVVIVDISGMKREPETPVADLREIIEGLAATNARAIGIAIDFSPRTDLNDPLGPRLRSDDDPEFFRYLHEQKRKGVIVFLGAHNSGPEADTWLGFEEYKDLAAEMTGFDEDMTRAPRWIRCGDEKLNSLSKALADAYGTRPEPPALLKRFLLDPDAPESLEPAPMPDNSGASVACERAFTLVNYEKLEWIQQLTLQATDRNSILTAKDTNGRSRFEGKLVIVGDAQRDKTEASFVLFGRRSPIPSSHIDAAAVYSIVGEPIYRFKSWVTVVLDFLVGLVLVLGLHHIRWRHRDDAQATSNRRESWFITISILVTFLLGWLVVKFFDVLWLDFFLVVFAWLLHSEVQRRIVRLPTIPQRP